MKLSAGDRINHIYFASEEHKHQTLLALSFEDKGEINILMDGLEFKGEKIQFTMKNIQNIHPVPNDSRMLGDWIQVEYMDGEEALRTANFIKLEDQVLMGKKRENTTELLNGLFELFNMKT